MAGRIRCISIDIDGTLYREGDFNSSNISPDNVAEIRRFCEGGGRIILSTGRDFRNTETVCRQLYRMGVPMDAIPYLVCLNGAIIVDNRDHRTIVYRRSFDPTLCGEVVEFLKEKRLNFFLIGSENNLFMASNPISKIIYKVLYWQGKFVYRDFPLSANGDMAGIQRIIIIKLSPGVQELKKKISEKFGDRTYCSSGPRHYLEVVDKGVNKFLALTRISRLMDVPIREFAAIGNEENDILSIQNAEYGAGVDLEKKRGNFHWDEERIDGHFTNESGNAVAMAIRDMRSKGFF